MVAIGEEAVGLPRTEAAAVELDCGAAPGFPLPSACLVDACPLEEVWPNPQICAAKAKVNAAAIASGFNQPHLKPAIRYLPFGRPKDKTYKALHLPLLWPVRNHAEIESIARARFQMSAKSPGELEAILSGRGQLESSGHHSGSRAQ
jgi:hypothetical protein